MSGLAAKPAHGYSAGANQRIWAIAWPSMIAGASAPLVGLVDAWAIGHLPDVADLAAVGAGATLFNSLFWAFGFLRMGTTGLVSQAVGAGDPAAAARALVQAVILAVAAGLCMTLFAPLILEAGAAALAVPDSIRPTLESYVLIRLWAAPFTLAIFALTGYLIAVERARDAMLLQLVLNGVNGAANLVFVLGFGWGAAGVAAGTVIAQMSAFALGAFMLVRTLGLAPLAAAARARTTWQPAALRRLLDVNGWLFVRTLALLIVLASVTREAAQMSPAALAASHLLTTYLMLISLGLDSFAYAAEALSGAAYGARDRARFRFWVSRTLFWSVLCALAYSALFAVFGDALTALITTLAAVRRAAHDALWVLATLPLVAVWCYHLDGVFVGATRSRAMAVTMILAGGVYWAALQPLTEAFGLAGLWLALAAFMAARGLFLAAAYPALEARLGRG